MINIKIKSLNLLSKITLLQGLNHKVDLEEKIFNKNKEKEKKIVLMKILEKE